MITGSPSRSRQEKSSSRDPLRPMVRTSSLVGNGYHEDIRGSHQVDDQIGKPIQGGVADRFLDCEIASRQSTPSHSPRSTCSIRAAISSFQGGSSSTPSRLRQSCSASSARSSIGKLNAFSNKLWSMRFSDSKSDRPNIHFRLSPPINVRQSSFEKSEPSQKARENKPQIYQMDQIEKSLKHCKRADNHFRFPSRPIW